MLRTIADFFDRVMRKYTPDPFVLALILTFVTFFLGYLFTPSSIEDMVIYWGDGFWNLISFTLQMVMILVGGHVVASAPLMSSLLRKSVDWIRNDSQAAVTATLVTLAASWINWGFGLIMGGFVCKEIQKAYPAVNYRLLIACAYSGFIAWHAGLAGSVPLLLATPGSFSEELLGNTIPVSETIFSSFNLVLLASVVVVLPLFNWLLAQNQSKKRGDRLGQSPQKTAAKTQEPTPKPSPKTSSSTTPAEWLENHKGLCLATGFLGVFYISILIKKGQFAFHLNTVNFIFLFAGILLHGSPRYFINSVLTSVKRVGPVILQFPFYSGIMGIMTASGLAEVLSQPFVAAATERTFPVLTFLASGFFNLFVPSGGGQWAMQGPIMIEAANTLGVPIAKASMALAWGDAWTNLLQPFWALPILAIAGIRLRDIMGYCVTILVVTGVLISSVMLVL